MRPKRVPGLVLCMRTYASLKNIQINFKKKRKLKRNAMTVKQNTSALGIWFVARVTICPGFPETILVYPYCPSVMMNRTPSLSEVFSVDGKLYGHPAHGP